MNQLILERETGSLGQGAFARIQASRALHDIQFSPTIRLNGGEKAVPSDVTDDARSEDILWAHQAGVNSLVVDRFENKLLITGGADSSIKVWNLQSITPKTSFQILKPAGAVLRGPNTHRFGITHLSFYPFDAQAFLSSSYDHTLKIYSSETLQPSASFDLESIIYTHGLSPIASHLLVACASQHPAIRLVDLRSGSSTHTLAGHHGAVLSVAWSPSHEHILASGGADGAVRIWDVRKSAGNIGLLDLEDSIGVTGHNGRGLGARSRQSSKAHKGAVNGLDWTDDGQYLVTAGHDAAVRVWNAATGANTLANFGPTLKNSNLSTLPLLLSPTDQTPPAQSLLFYPNEHEILVFELLEGRLLKRLKVPGPTIAAVRARTGTGERNIKNRIMGLSWRGLGEGFVSGHSDGLVRFWGPGLDEDLNECVLQEDGDAEQLDDRQGKRKRDVLEDVFRDLTRAKITFG